MWRHAVWNGAYFGLIFTVKDNMPKSKVKLYIMTYCIKLNVWQDPNQQRITNFAAGTVGGIVATAFNTPFDVVKTRVQSYDGVGIKKYNWTLPALATVAKEEGQDDQIWAFIQITNCGICYVSMASLYRGFLPKVLRLGPG